MEGAMARKAKILIVEDDPDMTMGLSDNLVFEGYEVLSAPTGEKGLELAKEAKPDCILLDIMLPGIDGYETCARLRRSGIRCPIIMLTGRAEERRVDHVAFRRAIRELARGNRKPLELYLKRGGKIPKAVEG